MFCRITAHLSNVEIFDCFCFPPYRAEAAGITIFQEIGLDPGIDHLLAMNCFDSVTESGGKVGIFILLNTLALGSTNYKVKNYKLL